MDHEYKMRTNSNRAYYGRKDLEQEIEQLKKHNEVASKEAEAIERRLNRLEVEKSAAKESKRHMAKMMKLEET